MDHQPQRWERSLVTRAHASGGALPLLARRGDQRAGLAHPTPHPVRLQRGSSGLPHSTSYPISSHPHPKTLDHLIEPQHPPLPATSQGHRSQVYTPSILAAESTIESMVLAPDRHRLGGSEVLIR